jgi:hypothetical protein
MVGVSYFPICSFPDMFSDLVISEVFERRVEPLGGL